MPYAVSKIKGKILFAFPNGSSPINPEQCAPTGIKKRNTAIFVNGGAGRVVCSIPALEKFHEENPDNDFLVICEGGTDFFKGHPILHAKA